MAMAGVFVQRFGAPEGTARRFLLACLVAGFMALAAIGVATGWLIARNAEHTKWVNHTYQVEVAIAKLQSQVEQTETSRRGYLLTGRPTYLAAQRTTQANLTGDLEALDKLTADNGRQRARIIRLQHLLTDLSNRQEHTDALVGSGRQKDAQDAFIAETAARRMKAIRDLLDTMRSDEQSLLRDRDAAQQDTIRTSIIVLGGAGLLIVLLALVTWATVLRYTRDLGSARDRLQLLNNDLEGAVAERTADLVRANEEIQRFAYIVSHDLRSPLVNVMGFTSELETANATMTMLVDTVEKRAPGIDVAEAAVAAREDLPEAIGFIRTSTQKMDRLINAILRLSREGRRVLVPEQLDLKDIAATVRDSLRHLADERNAEITIQSPLPRLSGDRLAIEQILSNLVENAVKYLSSDRPGQITIRGESKGDRRIIEVVDNGRGIAPADHARIFDLFRRSGAQDQPGEGIGLAHVRALVYRLGGTIDVHSTLGVGSTFRVTLPATLPDTGQMP
jgi:signal transduction histidine kinase